jgi:hypothetical protein
MEWPVSRLVIASILNFGQKPKRPWSQAAWVSANSCEVVSIFSAFIRFASRWNGVISRAPSLSNQTGLPLASGTGNRSSKPRTPRIVPK